MIRAAGLKVEDDEEEGVLVVGRFGFGRREEEGSYARVNVMEREVTWRI